uniref:DDE Tnp4 domain-containing protein n=1 Tax=Stegastes partitus TaxID=144197 RepID=A0A3B4ZK63_9TELE
MAKMDYLDYINDAQRAPPRPERRLLRDRSNPLNEFDDTDFGDCFRICKHNIDEIFSICELRKDYIKFPDAVDQTTYKVQFYDYGNVPGVISCIDGYHVPIKCPSTENAELYRNRKNWFSINIQGVSTPAMQFSSNVARWNGSTHDSRIFQNSSLCAQFEAGQHSGILLGDSGDAQTNFLFTPYLHPVTPEQQHYNQAHIHTRGLVERMFGIWKNRFHCIRNTLCFEPRRCCVEAVLHYYQRQHGSSDPPTEYCNDPHVPMAEVANNKTGHTYRDTFALQHFSKKNVWSDDICDILLYVLHFVFHSSIQFYL